MTLSYFDLWRSNCNMWRRKKFTIVFRMLRNPPVHIFIKIGGGHLMMTLTYFDLWGLKYCMCRQPLFSFVIRALKSTYVPGFMKIGGGHFLMTFTFWPLEVKPFDVPPATLQFPNQCIEKHLCTIFHENRRGSLFDDFDLLTCGGQTIGCATKIISPLYVAY